MKILLQSALGLELRICAGIFLKPSVEHRLWKSRKITDKGISQLLDRLRQKRCLVILDEAEAIFKSSEGKFRPRHGHYEEGYEGYGELLRRVGGERHQSCIVLTSREKPEEIGAFEGKSLPVRSLQVRGLQVEDAKNIFKAKGFSDSEMGLTELIDLYGGNPLALKVITTMIQEVFNGNISVFLKQTQASSMVDALKVFCNQDQPLGEVPFTWGIPLTFLQSAEC